MSGRVSGVFCPTRRVSLAVGPSNPSRQVEMFNVRSRVPCFLAAFWAKNAQNRHLCQRVTGAPLSKPLRRNSARGFSLKELTWAFCLKNIRSCIFPSFVVAISHSSLSANCSVLSSRVSLLLLEIKTFHSFCCFFQTIYTQYWIFNHNFVTRITLLAN